jgi:predicted nucleotidyltransferase
MERDKALKILSEHKAELQQKHGVKSIAIFGSTARNEARDDSDVDILVEFERPVGFVKYFRLQYRLEELLGQAVDMATPGGLVPELKDRIMLESINAG